MNNKKFFVTTPIYYSNGVPHIGHAYSSIIADVIATWKRINGYDVKFSSGVDENSQKVVAKAEELGLDVMEYADSMAKKHKAVWDGLGLTYTDFIRTTDPAHHKLVKEILAKCFEAGDIYEGVYEGLYCVGCEAFLKEDDLVEKNAKKVCPDHMTEPEKIKEKNWFFRLSKYQDWLEKTYDENPDFIIPNFRYNEVKAFVKRGLEDFSISRETNKFGITLPFDESQVAYVWFDALLNYITVCQNGDEDFWPASTHIVGKDILKFHGIYWPCMLKSAGYELPQKLLANGFFTLNGHKISKSLGNVIDPVEFSEKYSKDVLTLYLLSAFNIGSDGDFDEHQALLTYNARLANNLGNLVNRVVVLSLKLGLNNGILDGNIDAEISKNLEDYKKEAQNSFEKYELKTLLDKTFGFLDILNKYVDTNEPWKMIKNPDVREEAIKVLYTVAEGIRVAGIFLYPFFTEKMQEMFTKLGLNTYSDNLAAGELETILSEKSKFQITEKGQALFQRLDIEKK